MGLIYNLKPRLYVGVLFFVKFEFNIYSISNDKITITNNPMIIVGVGVSTTPNKTQYFINDVRQPRVINVTVVGAHHDAPVIVNKLISAQHIHHCGPWLLRLGNLAADVYCLMPNALIRFSFFSV